MVGLYRDGAVIGVECVVHDLTGAHNLTVYFSLNCNLCVFNHKNLNIDTIVKSYHSLKIYAPFAFLENAN